MVLDEKTVRRRAIFAFYDREGIVDEYIPHLLREMGPFCDKMLAVVNGELSPEGRRALEAAGAEVLLRENEGLDISGYRAGILHWRGELSEVDELVLFNQTVYGPIWPLREMFSEMDRRDLDFWGLTMHPGMKNDPWGTAGGGVVPHHLQSYFMAVRGEMLHSEAFIQYWQKLPPITSYYEAVGGHEVQFTHRFEKLGYQGQAYIDASDLWLYSDYPLMIFPYTLATKYRCPFIKRKTFFAKREEFLVQDPGEESCRLFEWLGQHHKNLAEEILKNLLRTESYYQIEMTIAPLRQIAGPAPDVPVLALVRDNPLAGPLAEQLKGRTVTAVFENEHARAEYLRMGESPTQEKNGSLMQLFSELTEHTAVVVNAGASTGDGTVFDRSVMEEGVQAALWGCSFLQEGPSQAQVYIPLPSLHTVGVTDTLLWEESPAFLCRGGCFSLSPQAAAKAADLLEDEGLSGFFEKLPYLPMECARSNGGLCGFVISQEGMRAMALSTRYMIDGISSIWATPYKKSYPQLLYRMQAVLDFFNERRYQMTIEQAVHGGLSLKEKMWIILRLLLGADRFEKWRYRLTGGKPPAPEVHERDSVD